MRYRVHYAVYYVNNAYYPNKTLTVTASTPEDATTASISGSLLRPFDAVIDGDSG